MGKWTAQKKGRSKAASTMERCDVDLGAYEFRNESAGNSRGGVIRICTLERYEHLRDLVSLVYEGGAVIIDYGPISNDKMSITRMVNQLRKVVGDVGGEVMRFGHDQIIVTSAAITIEDR